MTYKPTGWTNALAETGDFSTSVTIKIGTGDDAYTLPSDYIEQIEWIYETDVSGRTDPMDEMDITLTNVSGDFDIDNPDTLYTKLRLNQYIQVSMTFTDIDGNSFEFPMGLWLISERDYDEDSVKIICYDTSLPLTTASDVIEADNLRYGTYINNIKSYLDESGTPLTVIAEDSQTMRTDINILYTYYVMVGRPFSSTSLNLSGEYCFANGSIQDTESVAGVTFTFKDSSIRSLYFEGTATQIGYAYLPIFNISDNTLAGYYAFCVRGYDAVPSTGSMITAKFMLKSDDPSFVSENPLVSDQLHILMKTIFEAYRLTNTREGGYKFEPFVTSEVDRFAGVYEDRVLTYPQPLLSSEDAVNFLKLTYLDTTNDPPELLEKQYTNVQADDVSILEEDIELPEKQIFVGSGSEAMHTGGYWADRIAEQFWRSGIRYPTFKFTLIGAPEIEPKDLVLVRGKYSVNPFYVKKVTMTYDGHLESEVEALLLDTYTWSHPKNTIWQVLKDTKTWGEVMTVYKEFV